MQTFARLLSFVALLLSAGFLAQALPTVPAGNSLAVRDYNTPAGYNGNSGYNSGSGYNGGSDYTPSPSYSKEESAPAHKEVEHGSTPSIDLLAMAVKLHNDVEPICKELEVAATIEVATALVTKVEVLVKAFVALLVNIKLDIAVEIKTKIAVEIVACISIIVKALAAVCVKLGVDVCIALIAKIDVCLQLLLMTLNTCVGGLLATIISLCAKLDIHVLAAIKLLNLELFIKISALVKVLAGVGI